MKHCHRILLAAVLGASPALAQFNFGPREVRLDVGRPGEWNDLDVLDPQPLDLPVFQGFPHTMYYVGHGGVFGPTVPERYIVGVARSTDGIAWERYPTALLGWGAPGSWDDAGRIHKHVVTTPFPAERYRMYYSASDGPDGFAGTKTQIGLATSSDGLTFTKVPMNPILPVGAPGAWDDAAVFACCVLSPFETGHPVWRMWYTGYSDRPGVPGAIAGIGYATSPDGITWFKAPAPIAALSGGSVDGGHFYKPLVRLIEGRFHMWVTKVIGFGGPGPIRSVHYYTSPDGVSGWDGPYQPDGVMRYAHEAFPKWSSATSELELWHVQQGGGGVHPHYGVPYDNIAVAKAPIYREHAGDPSLLTATLYHRTGPLTLAIGERRAPDAAYGVMLDGVFNAPPISLLTPFGVLALRSPIALVSGNLDSYGYAQVLFPGYGNVRSIGMRVNLQAFVLNQATLSDALTNPLGLYFVE